MEEALVRDLSNEVHLDTKVFLVAMSRFAEAMDLIYDLASSLAQQHLRIRKCKDQENVFDVESEEKDVFSTAVRLKNNLLEQHESLERVVRRMSGIIKSLGDRYVETSSRVATIPAMLATMSIPQYVSYLTGVSNEYQSSFNITSEVIHALCSEFRQTTLTVYTASLLHQPNTPREGPIREVLLTESRPLNSK